MADLTVSTLIDGLMQSTGQVTWLRDGANAQQLQIYATFIDDSNYSRAVIDTSGGEMGFRIEEAGSGTGTMVDISFPDVSTYFKGNLFLEKIAGVGVSQQAPYADGTYTVGIGVSSNGLITIAQGVIVNIVQAS